MTRITLGICGLILFASQSAVGQTREQGSSSSQTGSHALTREARTTDHAATAAAQARHAMRDDVNAGLVAIISGGMDGAGFEEATDLAASLDGTRDHLRILPVAGRGEMQNVTDLVFARGIDVAVIQSDVLAALKRDAPFPGIERFLQYVTKLSDEEVHILARRNIQSLNDLASKKVNFGMRDSGSDVAAHLIFAKHGISVDATNFSQSVALERLREGDISAMVYVVSKPARLFQDIRPDENLHFLPIAAISDLHEGYVSAALTAEDYPLLISATSPVDTVAVGSVLAVYNWPVGTERYRKVAHFVEAFLDRLHDLQAPPHNPKWHDIDLASTVPGWTRFAPAEQWIKKAALENGAPTGNSSRHAAAGQEWTATLSPQDRDAVFKDFLDYQKRQTHTPGSSAGLLGSGRLDSLFAEFMEYQKQQTHPPVNNAGLLGSGQLDSLFAEFMEYQKRQTHPPVNSAGLLGSGRLDAFFAEFMEYQKRQTEVTRLGAARPSLVGG